LWLGYNTSKKASGVELILTRKDDRYVDMVLEIVTDTRNLGNSRNVQRRQDDRVSDSRKLQELRCVDSASGDNCFLADLDDGWGLAFG
jgi:hypothetical protein